MRTPREFTRRAVAFVVVAGIGMTLAAASAAPATASVDHSDRAAVTTAYVSKIVPAIATPVGWTGSTAGCRAGTTSSASQKATLAIVNTVRQLAGLSPVRLSPALSAKAQKAALVFKANSRGKSLFLTHTLLSNARCYSSDAKAAAASSNIAASTDGTVAGAKAVLGYLDEPGASNTVAGHRRWILSPDLGWIGVGSTNTTNALYVLGPKAKKYANPAWVTWPTAGYFPNQLEPEGLWSISGQAHRTYDFSHAAVTVKDPAGVSLKVHKYPVARHYGSDTLVFRVAGIVRPGADTRTYVVTLSGAKKDGKKVATFSYAVTLFDPTVKPARR